MSLGICLGMAKPVIDIVVWQRLFRQELYNNKFESLAYMQNTRVLSLAFNYSDQIFQDWNSLYFPRLESLHLRAHTSRLVDNLTRSWHIPNIQILSIDSDRTTPWLKFIEKWGKQIRILELILQKPD
jgi:hypothetical protein